MLLLNVHTYRLERFSDERSFPPYAILSHTWTDGKEVQYHDMANRTSSERNQNLDWKKIDYTCRQAVEDRLEYAWIDTCCIDKSSSAELSEAINSMYRWYQKAKVCYVYMADIDSLEGMENDNHQPGCAGTRPNFVLNHETQTLQSCVPATGRETLQIGGSRWFTRGWTLQELLAPSLLVFYDSTWRLLGDRTRLLRQISSATGIRSDVLEGLAPLHAVGIAARMSWASRRMTARIEDEAYCLLGIFNVNMPLLYGEGQKAFARLQEEILRTSSDHTIFAWMGTESQLLAPSPAHFAYSANIIPRHGFRTGDGQEMISRGCRISLQLVPMTTLGELAILDCVDLMEPTADVCIPLSRVRSAEHGTIAEYEPDGHVLVRIDSKYRHVRYLYRRNLDLMATVLLLRSTRNQPTSSITLVHVALVGGLEHSLRQLFPIAEWNQETKFTEMEEGGIRDQRAIWIELNPKSKLWGRLRVGRYSAFAPIRGVIFAWHIRSSPTEPECSLIRVAYDECFMCDRSDAADALFYKLRSDRESVEVPGGPSSRGPANTGVLQRNRVLTFSSHGILASFCLESIGAIQDGMVAVIDEEKLPESKMQRLRHLLPERPWRFSIF